MKELDQKSQKILDMLTKEYPDHFFFAIKKDITMKEFVKKALKDNYAFEMKQRG